MGLLLLIGGIYVLLKEINFSRDMLFYFYFINMCLEELVRMAIRYLLRDIRKRGLNQKHILLVGYSKAAEGYIDRILENPQWGYQIRGILDDNVEAGTTYRGIKVLGRIANLMVILPENRLDEIAITLGLSEYYRLQEIVAMCEKSGVHTKFIPDYNNIIPTKPYTEEFTGTSGHQYPVCATDQYVQRGGETADGYLRIAGCNHPVFSGDAVCRDHDQTDVSGTVDL